MNPKAFSDAFYKWIRDGCISSLAGKQVDIDGKSLRGARNEKRNCNVRIVHAWVHEHGMLTQQQLTDEKSNEITAIPALLEQPDIKDATLSTDAAGCRKNIVEIIRNTGGNYLLAVKANQPKIYVELVNLFEEAHKIDFEYVFNCDYHEKIEKNSGRVEKRSIAIISETSDLSTAEDWKDLQTVIEVINEATSVKGKIFRGKRYYISNLIENAQEFGARIRAHWGMEPFHWVLDVVFNEDDSRANVLHGAVNLGTLRRAAINIVKGDTELKKLGMGKVRRQAKWNEDGTVVKKIIEALVSVKSF